MKVRSLLIRGVFASILLTGCANSEGVLCRLDRGIMSIPSTYDEIFDFSIDGKYIWVETNCYDLAGHLMDTGKLAASSFPLPRMNWKKKLVKKGHISSYPYHEALGKIEAEMKIWFQKKHPGRELDAMHYKPTVTIPAFANPIILAHYFLFKQDDCFSIAKFVENDKIEFADDIKLVSRRSPFSIFSLEISPDLKNFIVMLRIPI